LLISNIVIDRNTDFDRTAKAPETPPETQITQTFEEPLNLSSPDDTVEMAARMKYLLAHQHNSQ